MAEQKIWEGSASSGAGGYRNLAQNYRAKHGNLVGFLEKYGAFQRGDKLYKIRVDGDRVKLASLTGYNAYQSRRQGREGYSRVRRELLALGVDPKEIDAFIKADKAEYKQIVSEVKSADKISAEPVQKGHVGSLKTGSPDVAGNIEPELRSVNVGKQSQSPIPEALLAEGRPRTSAEAFLRWRDPSGLPQPTDYTYEQRQQLRAAQTPEQVNDLLTEFDKSKPTRLIDDLNLTPAETRSLNKAPTIEAKDALLTKIKAARLVRNAAPVALSIPAGIAASTMSAQAAIQDPSQDNLVNAGFDIGNTVADLVGLIPTPFTIGASEAAQRALMMGQMGYNATRQLQKQQNK